MAIMGRNADPWGETSFEQAITSTSNVASQVKKAASDTAKTVAGDIKEQILTTNNQLPTNNQDQNPTSPKPACRQGRASLGAGNNHSEVKQENQELLAQTRANLQKIDQEIKKAREEREKKYQERLSVEKKEQQKKVEEVQKKKKEESALQKAIKQGQGSGERAKVAG